MGDNLVCESVPCGQPAVVFGIRGLEKSIRCERHVSCLVAMRMNVFDISGYYFISSHNDVAEFEDRKTVAEKGLENLSKLTASCESELSEALQAIDRVKSNVVSSVEQRFEEVQVAVTEAYNEVKRQLTSLQDNIEGYLRTRENRLSTTAQLVCAQMNVTPKFLRFGVADLSDRVSAILSDCWMVSNSDIHSTLKCLDEKQKKEAVEIALREAAESSEKGIQEALQYANSLIAVEEGYEMAREKAIRNLSICEKKRIEENEKWLRSSWNLRQRSALSARATVSVGQQYATVLYRQPGGFPAAEEILRHCYDAAALQSPLSADALSLCSELCSLYVASAQYEQAEGLGLWALERFASAGYSAELYWTVLLNLAYSMRERSNVAGFNAVFEKWEGLHTETKLGEMLRLLTAAVRCGSKLDAEKWLAQAAHIGKVHFPTSVFTALALFQLAEVSDEVAREKLHKQAVLIYETAAPMSVQAALNLSSAGDLYQASEQWNEAEKCYREAQRVFESSAPKSVAAAVTLSHMGDLFTSREQWSVAEESTQKSRLVFKVTSPKSESRIHLSDETMYFRDERWNEAEECYQQAKAIFEIAAPWSIEAAVNLANMGKYFFNNQNLQKAQECCQQAKSIFEVATPRSVGTASYHYNLGIMFEAMKQTKQAVECISEAERIYAENGVTEEDTRNLIARLRSQLAS